MERAAVKNVAAEKAGAESHSAPEPRTKLPTEDPRADWGQTLFNLDQSDWDHTCLDQLDQDQAAGAEKAKLDQTNLDQPDWDQPRTDGDQTLFNLDQLDQVQAYLSARPGTRLNSRGRCG